MTKVFEMKTNIQKFESIVANKVSGWHEKSKLRIEKINNIKKNSMIKLNELRLGNYLLLDNEFVKVEEIINSLQMLEVRTIDKFNNHDEVDLDYKGLQYAKTSEEILNKANFVKYEVEQGSNEYYWCHKDLPFAIDDKTWNVQKTKSKVEFVHKLQNFFFVHTGYELFSIES